MAVKTADKSDYSTTGQTAHTETPARDERRAMVWTPNEELAYAQEEKGLRTQARFDRFLQNFEKGAATDDHARDLLLDKHGLSHLTRDQHQHLTVLQEKEPPLQEWQLQTFRERLHTSVESIAHKYEELGYRQESIARITEYLDKTADEVADDKENQNSAHLGYTDYTPRTGRMNFVSDHQAEHRTDHPDPAITMQLHQAIKARTVNRDMAECYLTGNYEGSHISVAERLQLARLHGKTGMDRDGSNIATYAEALQKSQERLLEIFTEQTGLPRRDSEEIPVYLADVRKEMVGEHWKFQPPERTAEHALGLTPDGQEWKPTLFDRFKNAFAANSSPNPMRPDLAPNAHRSQLGLSQEKRYGPKY